MSKIGFLASLLFFASPWQALAQNCALSGTPAWSEQLRTVIEGCDNRFVAPDRRLTLRINTEGQIQVSGTPAGGAAHLTAKAVSPPAMVSWSPKSNAFFVNDGEGSGMSSTFRLFRVERTQVVEDGTIEKKAIALYRSQKKCSSAAADPNVWGIGWSSDGTLFYLLVQATANDPCGESAAFIGMTIRLTDGSIIKRLSEADTKQAFRPLLPREIYSK
jgi:hypothetical protein